MSAHGTKCSPDRAARDNAHLLDGIAFSFVPGLSVKERREAIERHGSAAAAFRARDWNTNGEAPEHASDVVQRAVTTGATVLVLGEPEYPEVLLELPQAPTLLYALGDASLLRRRCVGIVGTRHSSASGDRIAYEMAAMLARAGVVVVSGMAFGIDAAAHRGALDAGGGTIAVLGGGADVPYPPTHRTLHERIAREGLLVSEMPLGSRPHKGAFPRRNRIIAALSETLVVVEAGERSGALITSRIALELDRTVAAVPGSIDSPRHVGSNRLLFEGASFIGRVEDVLSIAKIDTTAATQRSLDPPDLLDSGILEAIRAGVSDVEDLARSTRMAPRDFAAALSSLELAGRILVTPAGGVALPRE